MAKHVILHITLRLVILEPYSRLLNCMTAPGFIFWSSLTLVVMLLTDQLDSVAITGWSLRTE
jgi:hypothetical protein